MQKQSKRRMKALVVTALGNPTAPLDDSVLKLATQHPVPKLPAGHVRIRTVAASLNFADMLQVQGSYQVIMPHIRNSCCDRGCTLLDVRRVVTGRELLEIVQEKPQLPFIPGSEVSGVVSELGE